MRVEGRVFRRSWEDAHARSKLRQGLVSNTGLTDYPVCHLCEQSSIPARKQSSTPSPSKVELLPETKSNWEDPEAGNRDRHDCSHGREQQPCENAFLILRTFDHVAIPHIAEADP